MSKNLLIYTLLTLLAISIFGATYGKVPVTYAQELHDTATSAEAMLSQLESREKDLENLFTAEVEAGGQVPIEATDAYNEAQQLEEEAQRIYDEGNNEDSLEKATDSLNKYGDALDIAQEAKEEITELMEETQTEDESEGNEGGHNPTLSYTFFNLMIIQQRGT